MSNPGTVQIPPVTTRTFVKTKVPTLNHPLSTPGYVIIVQFIWSCVFNVCIFILTYTFLVVVLPFALLYRAARKCIVYGRLYSRGPRNMDHGNAAEKFWLVTTTETRTPTLILLLIVKGSLGLEKIEYLVQNRLSGKVKETESVSRLARIPELIFRELVWNEANLGDIKHVKEVNLHRIDLFDLERGKFTIGQPNTNKEWSVELYTGSKDEIEKDLILFQFHHSFADIYTFVQFLSRHVLDEPTFVFRDDVSPTQALCLGCVSLLAGPSVFVKNLFKCKDTIFLAPSRMDSKRTLYFSKAIPRSSVETITTATGASVFDVILSCLAGSLRDCLRENGLLFPPDVNTCLQMNLQSSRSLKCFTSFNILSLPVATEGAIPRLWEMRLRHNNISSFIQAITMSTVIQLAFLILPDAPAKRLIQFLMAKSTCCVTCILGQTYEEELLLDGRSVECFIPVEDTGCGINITITEYEQRFQLAVLAPAEEDWVIKPARLCADFTQKVHELSTRLAERARVVRARGQKLLNSRKNSVFTVEEEE